MLFEKSPSLKTFAALIRLQLQASESRMKQLWQERRGLFQCMWHPKSPAPNLLRVIMSFSVEGPGSVNHADAANSDGRQDF